MSISNGKRNLEAANLVFNPSIPLNSCEKSLFDLSEPQLPPQ